MFRSIRNLVVITLPALIVLLLLLEVFFRTVIPASQQPQAYFDEESRIFKFEPGQGEGVHTIGWAGRQEARWRINGEGWNSPFEYDTLKTLPRIAVIGDSYIEALRVDFGENYAALMGERLAGSHQVYAFGISSAPLSQYLHMSRYVAGRFDPDIMIINVVMNDFDESLEGIRPIPYMMTLRVSGDGVEEVLPVVAGNLSQYSPGKRLLKKSALFRYLIYNLKVRETIAALGKGDADERYVDNTKLGRVERNFERIRMAVDHVIGTLASENPGRRILLVLDAPRQRIYEASVEAYPLEPLRHITRRACAENGIEVIDLEEAMTADFAENGRKFNSDIDNHWNSYGHEVVARTILGRLGVR